MNKDKELLFDSICQLECAEANLTDDIQALGYILDTCERREGNDFLLSQNEINNQLQTLLKSMIYNQDNIQKSINKYYKSKGVNYVCE